MKSRTDHWPDIIVDSTLEAAAISSRKRPANWRMIYRLPLAVLLGCLLLPLALVLAVLDGVLWRCDCPVCSKKTPKKVEGGR